MSYEMVGRLIEKYPEQQVSEKFKKREFVIEKQSGQFVDLIKIELAQEKTGLIEPFQIHDIIKVSFDIKGSKWKDSYFVNLRGWKIEAYNPAQQGMQAPQQSYGQPQQPYGQSTGFSAPPPPPPMSSNLPPLIGNESADDLPF